MKLLAVYGSLKKGFWNHDIFLKDADFAGTHSVLGAMQLAYGEYPYLFQGYEGSSKHKVEVYRISEQTYTEIRALETSSGYYPNVISTPYGNAICFFADWKLIDRTLPFISEYSLRTMAHLL